jgi:hypothetical protein
MRSEALEATGSDGVRLRVEFAWRGDRFGHVLSVVDREGTRTPLLESIEGTATDDWPPSPPLQSLRIENLSDGRQVALLVGMAGQSHWSASVEPVANEAALVFDIACRCRDTAPQLGTHYRSHSNDGRALKRPVALSIMEEPIPGQKMTARRPTTSEYVLEPRIEPRRGGTFRWKYRVHVAFA